jgi:zinc protease
VRRPGLALPSEAQLAAAIGASGADVAVRGRGGTQALMSARRSRLRGLVHGQGRYGLTEWDNQPIVLMLKPPRRPAPATAAQVVAAGAVVPFNVIQLRNALAGKAVVSAFIDEIDEGLSGGASPKDLETMFQLIYLTFTQPRADAATVATMAGQTKVMLANQQASPEYVFQQTLVAALTQDHPRARMMTPAMVDQMNLDRSFAFYKDRFADASDFTFVFAGSFDMEAIKPLVERYLASLPSLKRREVWKNDGIAPPRGVVEKVVRKGIEPKSQAAIVFTGPFTFDTPHEVALDAGHILEAGCAAL